MKNAGLLPYVFMLCGCGWFACMGLLARSLAGQCDWQTIALFRAAVAVVLATLFAWWTGTPLVFLRPRMLWLRSFSGSISVMAGFLAYSRMDVSTVLTIINTFPIWVALLSWPVLGESPSRGVWIAVGVSVVGITIALRPQGIGFGWLPAGVALMASISTAIAMLGLNKLKGVKPIAVIVHFSIFSTVMAIACFYVFDSTGVPSMPLDSALLWKLLIIGSAGTIGQVFLTLAFARGTASKVSVVSLAQVIYVMSFEGIMGWKQFDVYNVLGTALVFGAVAWLMSRERRRPKVMVPGEPIRVSNRVLD